MTYLQAALTVLRESQRPLTSREIVERAMAKGLILMSGKTPESTMSAVLYTQVAKGAPLTKVYEPGETRARRGSVRWTLSTER